jgi:hypothetical protein
MLIGLQEWIMMKTSNKTKKTMKLMKALRTLIPKMKKTLTRNMIELMKTN